MILYACIDFAIESILFFMPWLFKFKKSKVWWVGYRLHGQQFLRSTGQRQRTDAEKELQRVNAMIAAHKANALSRGLFEQLTGQALPNVTLKHALDDWLNEVKGSHRSAHAGKIHIGFHVASGIFPCERPRPAAFGNHIGRVDAVARRKTRDSFGGDDEHASDVSRDFFQTVETARLHPRKSSGLDPHVQGRRGRKARSPGRSRPTSWPRSTKSRRMIFGATPFSADSPRACASGIW